MATGGRDREARAARERARIYRARQQLHLAARRRRTRDNLVAAVVGGIVVLAAIGAQIGYVTAGPGAPEPAAPPAPSPRVTAEPTLAPEVSPDPAVTTPAVIPAP